MRIGFFLIFAALCSTLVAAQTAPSPVAPATPSADQMIEQLRSPRTRSLRNLQVEAVQPAQGATPSSTTATATNAATNPAASIAAPAHTAAQTPDLTSATPQASAPTPVPVAQAAPANSPTPQPTHAPAALSLLIQFDFDSARVKPESLQALANLATALKSEDLKTARFAIEGHTDAKGRADYNQRLSQIRAEAVSSYLQGQGIASARLQSTGKGASELVNRADPSAAENRRVRIVNLD